MTKKETKTISCPECGKEFEITQLSYIDLKTDPDLKKPLFHGDLFRETCPHCQTETFVAYPCICCDADRGYMLSLTTENLSKPTDLDTIWSHRFRFEKNPDSFLEHARILESGLNDRAFEIFRYIFLLQYRQQYGDPMSDRILFDFIDGENMQLEILSGDVSIATMTVPVAGYEMIAEKFIGSSYDVEDPDWTCVDMNWAVHSGALQMFEQN